MKTNHKLMAAIAAIGSSNRHDIEPEFPILKSWTEGGTALTNFSPEKAPLYEAAILAHGDPRFVIVSRPMDGPYVVPTGHSLHMIGKHEDASSFWDTFDRIRDTQGNGGEA